MSDASQAKLLGPRTEVVQVVDAGDQKSSIVVRFIDYDSMQRFSILYDDVSRGIVGREFDLEWPDYSPKEEADAASIALADAERSTGRTDWVLNNVTGAVGLGDCEGRRCLVVFLTPRDGNYSSLRLATVDLGKRSVIAVETPR